MKRVLIVEHARGRADGFLDLARHFDSSNEPVEFPIWRPYEDATAPVRDYQGLILSGGPLMVDELRAGRYPFWDVERVAIQDALDNEIPVLGVCLGGQILCDLLGGVVAPGQWVVGWQPLTIPASHQGADPLFENVGPAFNAMQFRRDYLIELPPGAVRLCSSAATENEAFRMIGRPVWGVLFHFEIDPARAVCLFEANREAFIARGLLREGLVPSVDSGHDRRQILENFVNLL